ncbi:hypothetical protein APHAL10511_004331 [Amanita phalloides]|nr:hypothetical protein APHAL10511_004331 [Amanita phalloides]
MGFLQRFFSLKSIRSKKKQKQMQQNEQKGQEQQQQPQEQRQQLILNSNEELRVVDDQEHEAAIGRLLRSSSARFAAVSELDYAPLSPLPHPINNVIHTPAASTVSLSSSNASHRGTYNVQVYKRKRHTSTEFPYANRHLDDIRTNQRARGATAPPEEHVHYLGLRSDPSVASLLELYDDNGRVPEDAFSNSPTKPHSPDVNVGRAQTRRSGSTLRQLLGAPSSKERSDSNSDLSEGDISWAERFLGEFDSVSSNSSLPCTENTPRPQFIKNYAHRSNTPINDDTDHDLSDNPAFNSMEVELSIGSTSSVNLDSIIETKGPYTNSTSKSPQRASQVFTFLTQKRRVSDDASRARPEPSVASLMSRSSSRCSSTLSRQRSTDNASELSREPSDILATPIPRRDDTRIPQRAMHTRRNSSSLNILTASRIPSPNPDRPRSSRSYTGSERVSRCDDAVDQPIQRDKECANEVKVLMTIPTKVIVTAPTPSNSHGTSRIPQGPRGPSKKRSSSSIKHRPLLTELSNSGSGSTSKDPYTHISRPFKQHRLRTSGSPPRVDMDPHSIRVAEKATKNKSDAVSRRSSFDPHEKENSLALSVKTDLPSTPMRSHSFSSDTRSLFRAIVTPSGCRLPTAAHPSPVSSSELSPVGRQLMMDVRQQRLKAREADRERSKRRSERHGNT